MNSPAAEPLQCRRRAIGSPATKLIEPGVDPMRVLLALCLLALPAAAQAEWMEASSPHFVVYADDSQRNVSKFAEELELYHEAMEVMTGLELPDPSPSNRVTVFVVGGTRTVQRLYGGDARFIGGFYLPRAGRSLAIVPHVQLLKGPQAESMIILLHEYAHHFLISNSNLPSPRWMGEGAAEFFASAEFPADGGISIGMPAQHRAGELFYAQDVKVAQLLDPVAYDERAHRGYDAFYGKSWLLYHYLTLGEKRPGQLRKYVALMAKGESSPQAGREAFGDLAALESELDKYLNQSKILSARFGPDKLSIGTVSVRQLSDGEAAMMPLTIRSRRGVTREQALELVTEVRKVAKSYPKDPGVLAELAEAEYDAGHDAEAIAAADGALAVDPKRVNAYVQKGMALFRLAAGSDDKDAAYKKAIAPFVALNKLENDNPLPLIYYFRSFAERGIKPSDQAVLGLRRAAQLAPFDLGLRLNLAEYQIAAGDYPEARRNLVPIAFDPHGSPIAAGARTLIERIDSGKPPSAEEAAKIMQPAPDKPEGEGGDARRG
jgi:tetratricopeptide (TPR) repeat protein